MNLRQTIRENWDAAFIVVVMGLILAWALFISVFAPIILGQTAPRAIVKWNAIPDARTAGYNVKRAVTATGTPESVSVGNVVAWVDENIEPTTRYWFSVAGFDAAGLEGVTGNASNNPFRFSDIQPASATSVVCSQQRDKNKVTLNCSWAIVTKTRSLIPISPPTGITYRCFLSNTGSVQTLTSLGSSIQIGGVPRHQTFYFYVTALWNGIESLGSPATRIQT